MLARPGIDRTFGEGDFMKKFLLGTLGLVALAAPAVAADLPVAKAPPMAIPVYDWTGFYIGGNVGWGQVNNCWDVDTAGVFTRDSCLNSQGAVVGGQAGYRWQIGPAVFGLEAQGDWANLGRSHISVLDPTIATSSKTSGLGVFTGQIGYSSGPGLFYVKGGAAVTSSTFGLNDAATGIGLASIDSTRWGGSVGAGFEWLFVPNWSVGLDWYHLFMGNANNTFSVASPVFAGALNRINQEVDIVTIRFNYKLGGYGGGVAARY
jgi:outer membrane immunogenic protein